MKTNAITLWTSLSLVLIFQTCSFSQTKQIHPQRFVSTVSMTGETDFVYYELSTTEATSVDIEGPGTLTVYHRTPLSPKQRESEPYFVSYVMDYRQMKSTKIGPQAASRKFSYRDGRKKVPSKAQKEVIEIPPGMHQINFRKQQVSESAHVRFAFTPSQRLQWKTVKPQWGPVPIGIRYLKSKETRTYRRISKDCGFKFTASDARRIRVYLRADFSHASHHEKVSRLQLKRNGEVVKTYKITCRKSKEVEFTNDSRSIPGTLRTLYIDIPAGEEHQYELSLKHPKDSAIVRVSLGRDQDQNL